MAVGFIQTENQAKNYIRNMRNFTGSRTFNAAYTANELAGARAEQQVEQQYGEQIGLAYKSAMSQRSNILSSGLGQGYKGALLGDSNEALQQAYDAYMAKMSESKSQIAEGVTTANEDVDEQVSELATKYAEYRNLHQNYAEQYFDWAKNNLTADEYYTNFVNSPDWQNYITYDFGDDTNKQETMNYVKELYANGLINETTYNDMMKQFMDFARLKTTDELSQVAFVEETDPLTGNTYKHYSSIVDENGNITSAGTNYFDLLENYAATRLGVGPSWEDYLSEQNPELYEWAKTYNPYANTDDPSFAGAFRNMYGTTSTDYQYTFIERFGGLSKDEVNTRFKDFDRVLNMNVNDINLDDVKGLVSNYKQLATQIGVDTDKVDWDALEKDVEVQFSKLQEVKDEIKSLKTSQGVVGGIGYAGSIASIIAGVISIVAGAILAVPTGGTSVAAGAATAKGLIGTGVAGLIGTSSAIAGEQIKIDMLEGDQQAIENTIKQMYLNSITEMVKYVQNKKVEQQIREYKSQQ